MRLQDTFRATVIRTPANAATRKMVMFLKGEDPPSDALPQESQHCLIKTGLVINVC